MFGPTAASPNRKNSLEASPSDLPARKGRETLETARLCLSSLLRKRIKKQPVAQGRDGTLDQLWRFMMQGNTFLWRKDQRENTWSFSQIPLEIFQERASQRQKHIYFVLIESSSVSLRDMWRRVGPQDGGHEGIFMLTRHNESLYRGR